MQDLLGRLTALDPDASETLKVVSYFDALVSRSVGVESMLRGAAVLSGTTVRLVERGAVMRVGADGVRRAPDAAADDAWPTRDAGTEAIVSIERAGDPHANDAMILERLALAVAIARARRTVGPESAVEIALSGFVTIDERLAAVARLRLPPDGMLRVVASEPDDDTLAGPTAVMTTRIGLVRATIVDHAVVPPASGLWGIGVPVGVGELPSSWSSALIARRLAHAGQQVIDAADLGVLLAVAEAHAGRPPHRDVVALAALDERQLELLDAIAHESSTRAAAQRLGRHHSSVQERLTTLIDTLGYDPRATDGRLRYGTARMLLALAD